MRFVPRHIGSGIWGIFDQAMNGWKCTDIGEDEARQTAADLNVHFDVYGPRESGRHREVKPATPVESATWRAAGELDWWVMETDGWWGRVRGPDCRMTWVKATDLRKWPGAG